MKNKIMKKTNGFTLIELIITVAILGIITAVAFPAYDRYKRKGYRMDAISYLTTAAAYQENWFAENGSYTANPAKLSKSGGTTTEHNHYNITVNIGDGSTFTMSATAKGAQVSDTDCNVFSIDNVGRKLAKKSDTSDNSQKCWGS